MWGWIILSWLAVFTLGLFAGIQAAASVYRKVRRKTDLGQLQVTLEMDTAEFDKKIAATRSKLTSLIKDAKGILE